MAWCEAHGADFLLGLARNARLAKEIEWHMARAEAESRRTGQPARRSKDFKSTTRKSWSRRSRAAFGHESRRRPKSIIQKLIDVALMRGLVSHEGFQV